MRGRPKRWFNSPARSASKEMPCWRCGLRRRATHSSAAAGFGGGTRASLHHAEHVAALAARLATQLVHERAHQEHAATAGTFLGGVQVWHRRQVKLRALID